MDNNEIAKVLNETSDILNESTGNNGLRRRIEIERGQVKAAEADKKIKELENERARHYENLKDSQKSRNARHNIAIIDSQL